MFHLFFFLLLLKLALPVTAQSVHNVTVGVAGSFFDPETVSAAQGDIVNFIFGGDIHDISQSNFTNPCSPLPGGFSSGFLGRGPQFTGPPVMFSLTVTNASEPIWYFCAATRPTSHCNSGMVGSINPPSQDIFKSFVMAAQKDISTPAFDPTLSLNGVGASATALVTLAAADVTEFTPSASATGSSTPPVTSSIASNPSPTSAPASSSHSNNHGAIIGGAVAAAVGAFILLCLATFCYRRYNKRRSSRESNFFAYNTNSARSNYSNNASPPATANTTKFSSNHSPNMITAFDADRGGNNMTQQRQPLLHASSSGIMTSEYTTSTLTGNSPLQPMRGLPRTNSAGHLTGGGQNTGTLGVGQNNMYNDQLPVSINRDGSYAVTAPAPIAQTQPKNSHRPAPSSSDTGSEPTLDIQTLAREVAAVLQKGTGGGTTRQGSGDPNAPTTRLDMDSFLAAPPRYHTTNSTSEG